MNANLNVNDLSIEIDLSSCTPEEAELLHKMKKSRVAGVAWGLPVQGIWGVTRTTKKYFTIGFGTSKPAVGNLSQPEPLG